MVAAVIPDSKLFKSVARMCVRTCTHTIPSIPWAMGAPVRDGHVLEINCSRFNSNWKTASGETGGSSVMMSMSLS